MTNKLTLACRACGRPLNWTPDQLELHLQRVERGEHAACACDDDCAARAPAWDLGDLLAALHALGAAGDRVALYKGRPVYLRGGADTRHESAQDWYANYGAHVSTLAAGDVRVQAVDYEWLDEDDHEVVRRLMAEDGELLEAEAYDLAQLARSVREAAEEVCGSLDAAVEAYRRGDLASVIDWLNEASSKENDHGDDPATSALASQLLAELPDDEHTEVWS